MGCRSSPFGEKLAISISLLINKARGKIDIDGCDSLKELFLFHFNKKQTWKTTPPSSLSLGRFTEQEKSLRTHFISP
jgi:hypothetical protein